MELDRATLTPTASPQTQWWQRTPYAQHPLRAKHLAAGRQKLARWTRQYGVDQAAVVGANPEGTPFDLNCGYCALDVDARLAGGPPATEETFTLPALSRSQMETILGVPYVVIDEPSVHAAVDLIPPGHRAIVGIQNSPEWAHLFNVANTRRGITIYDGKYGVVGIDPVAYQTLIGFPNPVEVGVFMTSDWTTLPAGHPIRDQLAMLAGMRIAIDR